MTMLMLMLMSMKRPLFVMLAVSIMLFASGCVNVFSATRNDRHSVEHIPNTGVRVENRNGSVSVIGDPALTEVIVEARLRAGGNSANNASDRLTASRVEISRDTSGLLQIVSMFPSPHISPDGADITIYLPEAASVEIISDNGRVTARNLAAALNATTTNARIELNDWTGDASLTTSNARVSVENHTGDLAVRSSNARMRIIESNGAVNVRTTNGRIELVLSRDQTGPIDVQTTNGSITAAVGSSFAGTMKISTSNGSISIDDAAASISAKTVHKRSAQLTFDDSDTESRLTTTNGRVNLRTRN